MLNRENVLCSLYLHVCMCKWLFFLKVGQIRRGDYYRFVFSILGMCWLSLSGKLEDIWELLQKKVAEEKKEQLQCDIVKLTRSKQDVFSYVFFFENVSINSSCKKNKFNAFVVEDENKYAYSHKENVYL